MANNSSIRSDVSVVVPMFNAGHALIDALESIRRQTLKPAFVHLVDDQSPSDDASSARAYIQKYNLSNWHIHKLTKNVGAGGARDFGIRQSTTKYIALLDADDMWLPDHLEKAFEIIELYELDLFGARVHNMSQGYFVASNYKKEIVSKIQLNQLLFKNSFRTSTIIFKREAYFRAGGFIPGQRFSEDYSLWLRMVSDDNNTCAVTSRIHALYRDYNIGATRRLSNNQWALERAELNNLAYLYKRGTINFILFFLSSTFSLLKYGRRIIIKTLLRIG